jgi:transposase
VETLACRTPSSKKSVEEHARDQQEFLDHELTSRLDEAKADKRRLYFVDAAHFVIGTYLCSLWCLVRLWIPAAAGRQRFNVLGAYDAISREMISITNTESVNTETMCDLVQFIERENRSRKRIPITLVLDNARYQRNSWVMQLAEECAIELLFLPSYSPNPNLIERYWRLKKREALYGRYYANFAAFRARIEEAMWKLRNGKKDKVKSMMTLNFQTFNDVLLQAA